MTMAIGVLSARVRVEEKRIMAALERAGVLTMPVPPAAMPLPPDPTLRDVQNLINEAPGCETAVPLVMIDRIPNRAVGRIMNRLLRQAGISIIDAGVASRRNRLQVASVWDAAGVPRPRSLAAFSEDTAMSAANQLGYPATMFPMLHSSGAASLPDEDTADAVIEHRAIGLMEADVVGAARLQPAPALRCPVRCGAAQGAAGLVSPGRAHRAALPVALSRPPSARMSSATSELAASKTMASAAPSGRFDLRMAWSVMCTGSVHWAGRPSVCGTT